MLEAVSLNASAVLLKAVNPTCLSLPNREMWTLGGYMLYRINYKRENSSLDMSHTREDKNTVAIVL